MCVVMCMFFIGGVDEDLKYINVRMKAIKKKILVLSGKGGRSRSSFYVTHMHTIL